MGALPTDEAAGRLSGGRVLYSSCRKAILRIGADHVACCRDSNLRGFRLLHETVARAGAWLHTGRSLYAGDRARPRPEHHPPLHQWLAHAAAFLFGETHWGRAPFLVAATAISWPLCDLTRCLFSVEAGLWAVFAFNFSDDSRQRLIATRCRPSSRAGGHAFWVQRLERGASCVVWKSILMVRIHRAPPRI